MANSQAPRYKIHLNISVDGMTLQSTLDIFKRLLDYLIAHLFSYSKAACNVWQSSSA